MDMTLNEIEKEIANLPSSDKEMLLSHLLGELDGSMDEGVNEAWLIEAKHRYQQLKEGEVESIPGEVVIERVKDRLRNET